MTWKTIICCKLIHIIIKVVGGLDDDAASELKAIVTSISVDGAKQK